MTTILLVAVVVLALLVMCDVMVTGLVIRRLRGLGDHVSTMGPDAMPDLLTGQPVPSFGAVAEHGELINTARLKKGRFLVGFFSAGCGPCHDAQPELLRRLRDGSNGVVVVTGARDGSRELVDAALATAPVVVENETREVSKAFGVRAFPTFVVVEDGVIGAFGIEPGVLDVTGLGLDTPVVA